MISVKILKPEGVVVIEPAGPLEKADFEKLASEVDSWLEEAGPLGGIIIHARAFPGWESFEALVEHMKFVRGHHARVGKVALVMDSKLLGLLPGIAKHFVAAEVRHFDYEEVDAAKRWVLEKG